MGQQGCAAGRCGNPAALHTLPRRLRRPRPPATASALGSRTGARLHFTVAAKVFFRTIVRLPDLNLRPWDAAPTRPRHTRLRPSRFSVGSADDGVRLGPGRGEHGDPRRRHGVAQGPQALRPPEHRLRGLRGHPRRIQVRNSSRLLRAAQLRAASATMSGYPPPPLRRARLRTIPPRLSCFLTTRTFRRPAHDSKRRIHRCALCPPAPRKRRGKS